MWISKTGYRLSISGGSTDTKSFYKKYGETLLIGASLSKSCYVSVNKIPNFDDTIYQIFYSNVEKIHKDDINLIKNLTVRGTLKYLKEIYSDLTKISIYISSEAPHLSGLGSSSSLILGILNCVHRMYNNKLSPKELADQAILIERGEHYCNQVGGIQDAIWPSFGSINSMKIDSNGSFIMKPLPISKEFIEYFKKSSLLVYINSRKSFDVAASHENKVADDYKLKIRDLSYQMYDAFCSENIISIGEILNKTWEEKRKISNLISNENIDKIYSNIIDLGCYGGRLMGTGGGGCMFIVFSEEKRDKIINEINLPTIPIDFDYLGSRIIFKED